MSDHIEKIFPKGDYCIISQDDYFNSRVSHRSDLSQYNRKHQYIVFSQFEKGSTARIKENVIARLAYTVEHDCISKKLQSKLFREMLGDNTAWVVDSANKSYHYHIVLSKPIVPESDEDKELQRLLRIVFPFVDTSLIVEPHKLVRNPNGIRKIDKKKKITKEKPQKLLKKSPKQNYEQLIKKLIKLANELSTPSKIIATPPKIREPRFEDLEKDYENIVFSITQLIKHGYDLDNGHIKQCLDEMCKRIGKTRKKCVDDALRRIEDKKKKEIERQQELEKRKQSRPQSIGMDYQGEGHKRWVKNKLAQLDIIKYLYPFIRNLDQVKDCGNGEYENIRCIFPWHNDSTPSGFIKRGSDGVQYYYCNGCMKGEKPKNGCMKGEKPKDLLGLYMAIHQETFAQACIRAFGFSYREKCDYCENPVLFDSTNKCYNLDERTLHQCKKDSKKKITQHYSSLVQNNEPQVSFIEPDTSKYKKFEHLAKDIRELKEKEVLLFSAPTGSGKTYFLAQEIIRLCCKTSKCITVLTNSINSVKNIYNEIIFAAKSQGIDSPDVTKNVLGKVADDENYSSKRIGRVAIATYYSLGRKGHTNTPKSSVSDIGDPRKQLLGEDRILFCDEIQSLIEFCKVNEPLAARYYRTKDTYNKIQKCQVSTKNKDACTNCVMAYKRKAPDSKFQQSHFPNSFFEDSRENHQDCELITEIFDDLWNIKTYDNCEGVFTKMLEENINYELEKPRDIDKTKENDVIFSDFLRDLLSKLKYPQLSMSSPVNRETQQPIAPGEALKIDSSERSKQVMFYPQTCRVPHLKGYDILPLLQILQSEKIIMCSATIPDDTAKLLDDILPQKGWSFRLEEVDKEIVKFSAMFLTTKETLSQHTLVELAKALKEETIIVAKTKTEASAIYWSATETSKLYDGGQFIETIRGETEEHNKQILVTYLRSTLLTGLNFPNKNVMVVDCNSFFPQIICTAKTRDDRRIEMLKKLQLLITQSIGRLLRTTEEKRKIGVDDRNIVFVLHGIPTDLKLELDDRLFSRKETVSEIFVTKEKVYNSIRKAIEDARRTFQVKNYRAEEIEDKKQYANSRCKKHGRSALSKNQRKFVQPPDEKRFQNLMCKAWQHKGTWRQFYISANISRLKKNGKIDESQEMELRQIVEEK